MKERHIDRLLLTLGIIFVAAFCLTPFVWMLIVALSKRADFLVHGNLQLTFANFVEVVSTPNLHFLYYLRNSLLVASITALASTMVGVLSAYAVSRISFRGKSTLILIVLALSMFPQICIVGYLFKIMNTLRLINTHTALILPYIAWSVPLALWLQMSYLSLMPAEVDKAAQVDGASRLQIIFRIVLPMILPGFLSTVLLLFMFSFNEFLFALMLTTDHSTRTVPVGIALFQGLHGELPWGHTMAASTIACIPVITIALIFQRRIIHGLTHGAVNS